MIKHKYVLIIGLTKHIDFEGFKMRVIVTYFRVFKNEDKIFIVNKNEILHITNSI